MGVLSRIVSFLLSVSPTFAVVRDSKLYHYWYTRAHPSAYQMSKLIEVRSSMESYGHPIWMSRIKQASSFEVLEELKAAQGFLQNMTAVRAPVEPPKAVDSVGDHQMAALICSRVVLLVESFLYIFEVRSSGFHLHHGRIVPILIQKQDRESHHQVLPVAGQRLAN